MVLRCSCAPAIPSEAREPYPLTGSPIHCGSHGLYGRGSRNLTCVAQALLPVHGDDRGECRHRQECLCHIFLTLFTPILKHMWPQPGATDFSRRFGDHRHRTNRFYYSGPSACGVRDCGRSLSPLLTALSPAQSHCRSGSAKTCAPACQTRYRSPAWCKA